MIELPSHDALVLRIQKDVIEAVNKVGWTDVSKSCWGHHVSLPAIKKIYCWTPYRSGSGEKFTSFNLGKLYDAHSWAEDVLAGRCIRGSEWQG